MSTTLLRTVIAFSVIFFLASPMAYAEPDPLRLTFVNVSKKGGSKAHKSINNLLKASDDIKLSSTKKFLKAVEEEGLDKSDLRSGKKRDANPTVFQRAMKARNVESALLIDVYSKGRKLQVVVIGPNGTEVADIRRSIKGGKIKKSEAKSILKEAFGALVPAVKEFRAEGGWGSVDLEEEEEEVEEEEAEEEEEEEEEEAEESEKDKAVKNKRAQDSLSTGYDLKFGALIGARSFSMTEPTPPAGQNAYVLDHASPFVGVWLQIDALFTTFGDGTSGVGASVFGGYAPFTTVFEGETEFASAYARVGAELKYVKAFSGEVSLDIYGGAEAMSVTIDQNEFYTGNRYLAGRLGALVHYDSGRLFAGGGGGILPAFDINNSNGAFGDAPFALGFEFKANIGFRVTDQINLELGYDLETISSEYPEPKIELSTRPLEPLEASDTVHSAFVTIGYRL